jgi:hypothetical protein
VVGRLVVRCVWGGEGGRWFGSGGKSHGGGCLGTATGSRVRARRTKGRRSVGRDLGCSEGPRGAPMGAQRRTRDGRTGRGDREEGEAAATPNRSHRSRPRDALTPTELRVVRDPPLGILPRYVKPLAAVAQVLILDREVLDEDSLLVLEPVGERAVEPALPELELVVAVARREYVLVELDHREDARVEEVLRGRDHLRGVLPEPGEHVRPVDREIGLEPEALLGVLVDDALAEVQVRARGAVLPEELLVLDDAQEARDDVHLFPAPAALVARPVKSGARGSRADRLVIRARTRTPARTRARARGDRAGPEARRRLLGEGPPGAGPRPAPRPPVPDLLGLGLLRGRVLAEPALDERGRLTLLVAGRCHGPEEHQQQEQPAPCHP